MERIRDYGGFVVLFMGFGYLAGWALAGERLATLPAGLHAIGLTAVAFLPLRAWSYWRGRPTSADAIPLPRPSPVGPRALASSRRRIKPRNQFGLRGLPR